MSWNLHEQHSSSSWSSGRARIWRARAGAHLPAACYRTNTPLPPLLSSLLPLMPRVAIHSRVNMILYEFISLECVHSVARVHFFYAPWLLFFCCCFSSSSSSFSLVSLMLLLIRTRFKRGFCTSTSTHTLLMHEYLWRKICVCVCLGMRVHFKWKDL